MTDPVPERLKILFLFSDTGGGHRSAAEAIIEALGLEYGDRFSTEMVDIFKDYSPPPLDLLPGIYPYMVKIPDLWEAGFRLSNGRTRTRALTYGAWLYTRRQTEELIRQHPADLVVSVHPLAAGPVLKVLGEDRPPYINVVTDLVSTHAIWYHRQVDLCIVPTAAAYRRALYFGLRPDQVVTLGLPVAERFSQPAGDRMELRARLGWPQERTVVLLVGGGEGMGPLEHMAHALGDSGLPLTLVVVAGRNKPLQERLEGRKWSIPVRIYGFTREMPDFMHAADILVSKAGPGTISEAFISGLPIVLYSRLPGQEDGNVSYVTSVGAGVWAAQPRQAVAAIRNWVEHPESFARAAEASRSLARPDAARQIARLLNEWAVVREKK